MTAAVGVAVKVAVAVAVDVEVAVPVAVAVTVPVDVAVGVLVGVGVNVSVGVADGSRVGVKNWRGVAMRVAVGGPAVSVAEDGVLVGIAVIRPGSSPGDGVLVGVSDKTTGRVGGTASGPPSGASQIAAKPAQ